MKAKGVEHAPLVLEVRSFLTVMRAALSTNKNAGGCAAQGFLM
jgi:hypothetical protein